MLFYRIHPKEMSLEGFPFFLAVAMYCYEVREGSEFTTWGVEGLYFSASKIKPAPPAGGQKFYLAPSEILQLK